MIVIPAASCKNNEFEAGVDIKDTSGTAIEGPNANIQDSGSTDTVKDPDDTDDNIESSTDDTFSSVSAEESSSDEVSDDVYIPESSDEESIADQISIESELSEISTVHESSSSTDHSSTESSVDTEHSEDPDAMSVDEEDSPDQVSQDESDYQDEESIIDDAGEYSQVTETVNAPDPVGFMLYRAEDDNDDNVVSVRLEEGEDISGYVIEYSTDSHFRASNTKSVTTKKRVKPIRSLEMDNKYYFRVKTFRGPDNKRVYSSWSQPKIISLKKAVVVNGVTYIDGVLIANKTYALPRDFGNGLTSETLDAFYKMSADAASEGLSLWITSGFRSYDIQSYTYDSFVYDRGTELADLCSARPGHSEHQSGLAIDVNTTSDAFAWTDEAAWLEKHCTEYGFIIRYPKDKHDITGYKYEPWHIRYLGIEKAKEIAESGLTIEEYYGITSYYH